MGVLKTLAIGLGVITAGGAVAMAVPDVRNKTLDLLAPHSQVYKTQEKDLKNTKENLESAQKEIDSLKSTLVEKLNELQIAVNYSTDLQNQISDLNKTIKDKNTEITNLNNQLTAKQQELDTQTAYLETCQTKASEIKTQIESLTQEDVIAYAETISTLQEDLEAIQTEIVNVENNINTLNATITNLNSNIETLTQEKQDLQNQVNTLTQTLSEKETEINNLNAEITSLNNQITSLQEQVESLSNSGVSLDYDYYNISNVGNVFSLDENYYNYCTIQDLKYLVSVNSVISSGCNHYSILNVKYGNVYTSAMVPDASFDLCPIFKITGEEKNQDEMLEYLNSFDNLATNLQVKSCLNLSDDNTNATVTIDIVDFPLTGKYISSNNNFIDFDKKIISGQSNILDIKLGSDIGGIMIYLIYESYSNCLNLEIISDTEISINGETYTKVNEENAIALEVGSYAGDNTSTYVLSEDGSLSVEGVGGGGCWLINEDKLYIFFEGSRYIAQIISTTSFEFDGNTYTKQVETEESDAIVVTATLPEDYVGVYTSPDDDMTFNIDSTTTAYYSSSGTQTLIRFINNVATFESIGDIVFTGNEDGSISFEWNGNTYTKQAI